MRIIHCADVHLDSALNAHLGREKSKVRRNEILNTFSKMFGYAEENDIQAVIIAGDLFDSETVSATTINVVIGEIAKHADIDVFYLRGNHDPDDSIFAGRKIPENLYLFGEEWIQYKLKESLIVITGVILTADNCASIYDEIELDEDYINIVTLHGQEQEYGRVHDANDVCMRKLRNIGIDYLALGHVHGRKFQRLDHRGVYCYPGCLEGRGFDECGEHGFMVLDVDERSHTVDAEFVPFAKRRLYSIDVDLTSACDSNDAADRVAEQLYGEIKPVDKEYGRDLVRICLTGSVDVENEISIPYIEEQFKDSFYYLEIRDKTKLYVDPLRYAGDATLKGEFVRTVMAQNLTDDDKAFVIQTGIRALANEEIEL